MEPQGHESWSPSRVGTGGWGGLSPPHGPPAWSKRSPWDQHDTCTIWALVRKADSQASPRWTEIRIFPRHWSQGWFLCLVQGGELCPGEGSLICSAPFASYLLQPPSYLLARLCSGKTQTSGVASILLICLPGFVKILGMPWKQWLQSLWLLH